MVSLMKKINVAIDGPSASGKGVTAKRLAEILGYNYLDTGAMYRAVAYFMIENNIDIKNFREDILKEINIDFDENNNVILNGENIEGKIRNSKVSMAASNFSKIKEVRKFLVSMQKRIVENGGYIADGRDIGSVVIPDAEVKIFLTADVDVRARRRYLEMIKRGERGISEERMREELIERDRQDMERDESPLVKVEGAVEIDTSEMMIDEQVKRVLEIVERALKRE